MRRRAVISAAVALTFSSAGALAQDGDLSRVTMRVLDDLRDAEAVVLELDANRGEGDEGAAAEGRDGPAAAGDEEGGRDAARPETDDSELRDLRTERAELHDDDDDRAEGRREDRDVERPATPPAPTP